MICLQDVVYATSSPGIGGLIKRRIGDFIVEEIALDGKVCEVKAFTATEKLKVEKTWPENTEQKENLILQMEKFNSDVNNAIRKITRFVGTSKKRIGYGGMKDKRGITCQRISFWQPDIERLKQFESRYIDLRPIEWSDERVELGDLQSNRFTIIIRDLKLEKEKLQETILQCFEQMKNGIPNYFGEQRFGGARNVTHIVGREFVKGNPEEAVKIYLTATFPAEEEAVRQARENLAKTWDYAQATKEFPTKFRYERAILHHLCKYPKDFVGAFGKLPKQLRYMFTHAYQAHLFNKIVAERMKAGIGLKAVEGDVLQDGLPTAALFGCESTFAEGKPGEIERKVLAEEGIELSQFKVAKMAELSSRGTRKPISLFPQKLQLLEIAEDEFYPGSLKAKVGFELTKGNYATTVLAELMKT